MTLAYGEIFAHRGAAYHRAMLRWPHARDAEFAHLFDAAAPSAGQRVLDLPAGGGYLGRHLPPGVEVLGLEISAGFSDDVRVYDPAQPWTHGRFDHAVCLAALHHIEHPADFLSGLLTHLHAHGTLHLADIAQDSGIVRFLDGFVGRHNITGHDGHYLPRDPAWLAGIGQVTRCAELPCAWSFDDESQMLAFCAALFGLLDCPPAALRDALGEHVGFRHHDGKVSLDWRLLYADLQPTTTAMHASMRRPLSA